MPRSRRAWACWNYHIDADDSEKATVTYNMNILQSVKSKSDFLVTLNCPEKVDPQHVIQQITYHHPIFAAGRRSFQLRHQEQFVAEFVLDRAESPMSNPAFVDAAVHTQRLLDSFRELQTANALATPSS